MPLKRPTYLRTGQVAEVLQVSPKTVSRWSMEGRLPHRRTLGGHRRYDEETMKELAKTLVVKVEA